MSKLSDILSNQIKSAEKLIDRVKSIPDGTKSVMLSGFIQYDARYTRPLMTESDGWQIETKEILISLYGENARQTKEFQGYISNKNHYFRFREDLSDELENCKSFLQALIKADKINQQLQEKDTMSEREKTPMVFISHSSQDKKFAEALVNLLEDLGMDNKNVFCSSVDGYGVSLGKDIFETLRGLFTNHSLFVMFIHSPRYYKSPVSLNEMGAAWVLKSDFCSFLTKDFEFSEMVGVIDGKNLSIKVNNDDAPARLNELKDWLISLFHLPPFDGTGWERKRNYFLKTVCNLEYSPTQSPINDVQTHKAIIRAYSEKIKSGQRSLIIKNEGDSSALNLIVSTIDKSIWCSHPPLPKIYGELLPGAQRTITLALIDGQNEATLHLSWDDESQKNNTINQTIDL